MRSAASATRMSSYDASTPSNDAPGGDGSAAAASPAPSVAAVCATIEPRIISIPHVKRTSPAGVIGISTACPTGNGRRIPRSGKTTSLPHPSSVVRVKTSVIGAPARAWIVAG
jgi:hypothetical protein